MPYIIIFFKQSILPFPEISRETGSFPSPLPILFLAAEPCGGNLRSRRRSAHSCGHRRVFLMNSLPCKLSSKNQPQRPARCKEIPLE